MIQVRTAYQIKFGKIDQAVALFTRLPQLVLSEASGSMHYHLLTDISGPMYTLVEEIMIPNLGVWDTTRDRLFGHTDFAEWFKEFQLIVEGGRHEFYTIEGTCEDWTRPGVLVVRQVYRAFRWQIRPAVTLLQRYGALMADAGAGRNPRILTDVSGEMFQAVIEIETDGLSEWESHRRTLFTRPEFQLWFVQLTGVVDAGAHEFYRVEA